MMVEPQNASKRLLTIFGYAALLILLTSMAASAQPPVADPMPMNMSMPGMENSVGYLASGTSIEPASTSASSSMLQGSLGQWTVMFHANGVLTGIQQTGPRGGDKVFSTNWIMPMFVREFGKQTVTFRTMLSFEPASVTQRRFPQLFQTGETAFGLPIIDGQHPHNFVMELAGRYDFKFNPRASMFFYGGPIGEPALGPTAFPHRSSASQNPLAILGHHEQDSTHISYSVITAGLAVGRVQVEASTFHGQEPDESRWKVRLEKPDSFASRLTIAPTENWSGQFSIGRINHREAHEPGLATLRTTASLHHNRTLGSGSIATSLIWGRNKDVDAGEQRIFNAYAAESTLNFKTSNWLWTRIENLDKDRTLLSGTDEEPIGRVQSYSVGYERDIVRQSPWMNIGLGFQYTAYGLTSEMKTVYGNRPQTFTVFMRLRPVGNMSAHMRMHHH